MAEIALWEDVVRPLTGFDGGKREDVGQIGGTPDSDKYGGRAWLTADLKSRELYYLAQNVQTKNPEYSPERTIQFYDDASSDGYIHYYYEAKLSVPWSSEDGSDFSDGGVAGKFDYSYGKALETLKTLGTAATFPDVPAGDSVDLNSFIATAKSFDAVRKFFEEKEAVLAGWMKQLGEDDAAWRGTSADAFRELIDGIHGGYKNFLTLFGAGDNAPASAFVLSGAAYTPTSAAGKTIIEASNEIKTAADDLFKAWEGWMKHPNGGWLPTHHLDYWLDQVAHYLNTNNIALAGLHARTQVVGVGQSFGTSTSIVGVKEAGFSIHHPDFGDLRYPDAWRALGQKAYQTWVGGTGAADGPIGLKQLDDIAGPLAVRLNRALATLGEAVSSFPFTIGFSDLRARFTGRESERKAEEQQRELERQKEEAEKQKNELESKLGGGPPPGLGPNGLGNGNNGLLPPPGLGLNGPGPGTGNGKGPNLPGGPDSLTPLPGLGSNGPGPVTVRNPDGSVSVRNPDGSYTTTYPDGRKETTPPGTLPPGALPPGLTPNPSPGLGGLPGSGIGSPPLKTVKGPDGSTTSYNQDGSRTITHKDGAATTIGRDGTVTTVNPGGSTTVLHRDGSQSVSYPDGTKTTFKPDGSSVTQYKNGTVVQRAPDGTLTTTDSEGNKTVDRPAPGETVKNPDGSTTTYNKDGSATTVHANGIRTTIGADGTITTLDPDGTKTVSRLGQNTSTIEYADGSVAKVEKDGTVVTTYKDGSTTRLGPDGTYTTTDPDGKKTTEHLNPLGGKAGAITQHNVDGSTTTRYPDGTVDQEYKDGRRKVTYPDGRTVTTDADGRTVSVTGGKGSSGLGSNGGGRFGDGGFDYLDRERKKSSWVPNLYNGGTGGSQGAGGSPPPTLSTNSIGNSFLPPGSGPGTGTGTGSTGSGSGRSVAVNETTTNRVRPNPVAEETAVRRPATSSGMMPMMPPPMGGMGGMGGGQGNQGEERERATWVSEDEEVWGTDEGGVAGVIGR
ncbi:AAWKG family protein [Streptomyces sp. NPDC094448]|uniref:AAWKG family protein n=1 Tax=Streptomyces sp. NPDC094448 TaxID=3366063 RepID=UPI003810A501